MSNYKSVFIALFAWIASSCNADSSRVEYDTSLQCPVLVTACTTNHQGEHPVGECDVYIDNDTLVILFPAPLPAYWASVIIKVYDGGVKAEAGGVPFDMHPLAFETGKQRLVLNKARYTQGDTLCAHCYIEFKETDLSSGRSGTFYFKGTVSEVVRTKGFDPFATENFKTFDLNMALHELGEPLYDTMITTSGLPEFSVALLNHFPPSAGIRIRELTWNSSPDRDISDGGMERITIWYHSPDNTYWLPVTYIEWNTEMQF